MPHPEHHAASRIGWLRAAVLGANDGILSTAGLLIGVAAAGASRSAVLVAGLAGLTAGALSMAAGEYVSVSSQKDAEEADVAQERRELATDPHGELVELAGIYEQRGLDPDLAVRVATELMAHDALEAHARDELGITRITLARPIQAALASAAAFTSGALLPLVVAGLATDATRGLVVALMSLVFLCVLGALGAWAGGAPIRAAAVRVTLWGAAAMVITYGIGRTVGTIV
jgi:VIT1/CCC1 family predicted Fe2+/Mn2+ transporter